MRSLFLLLIVFGPTMAMARLSCEGASSPVTIPRSKLRGLGESLAGHVVTLNDAKGEHRGILMSLTKQGTTRAPQVDIRFYSFADGTVSTLHYDLKNPQDFKNLIDYGLTEDLRAFDSAISPQFQPVKFSAVTGSLDAISAQLDLTKPVRLLVLHRDTQEATVIDGFLRLPSWDDQAMAAIEGRILRVSIRTNDGPKVADPLSILAAYGTPK